jgi:hypothetical protein
MAAWRLPLIRMAALTSHDKIDVLSARLSSVEQAWHTSFPALLENVSALNARLTASSDHLQRENLLVSLPIALRRIARSQQQLTARLEETASAVRALEASHPDPRLTTLEQSISDLRCSIAGLEEALAAQFARFELERPPDVARGAFGAMTDRLAAVRTASERTAKVDRP